MKKKRNSITIEKQKSQQRENDENLVKFRKISTDELKKRYLHWVKIRKRKIGTKKWYGPDLYAGDRDYTVGYVTYEPTFHEAVVPFHNAWLQVDETMGKVVIGCTSGDSRDIRIIED